MSFHLTAGFSKHQYLQETLKSEFPEAMTKPSRIHSKDLPNLAR